jgi:ornithine carbamoyltransferase
VLRGDELQLTRGESVADTGRVLSRYVAAIAIRSGFHDAVAELAESASVPVINALTPLHHPCQALADLLTLRERFGSLDGVRVAYLGDGNNVCHSLMRVGGRFGMNVVAATPAGYEPSEEVAAAAAADAAANGGSISLTADPREAAAGAHVLYTDVWTSMGQDDERERRLRDLEAYRIDDALLDLADPDGIVLHCLPAHVGEEIAESVLYGPRSLVWDQAENRLHTQKAVMALVIR